MDGLRLSLISPIKNPGGLVMDEQSKDIWFPAKKYGVGWGLPITWQGWLILAIYMALVTIGTVVLVIAGNPVWTVPFILYISLLSGVLIFICYKKGEKIKFRWGKKP